MSDLFESSYNYFRREAEKLTLLELIKWIERYLGNDSYYIFLRKNFSTDELDLFLAIVNTYYTQKRPAFKAVLDTLIHRLSRPGRALSKK
ncbi:MAG: hypothetical protein ACLFQV_11890 [Vulcanimicrobiota bacterium]